MGKTVWKTCGKLWKKLPVITSKVTKTAGKNWQRILEKTLKMRLLIPRSCVIIHNELKERRKTIMRKFFPLISEDVDDLIFLDEDWACSDR